MMFQRGFKNETENGDGLKMKILMEWAISRGNERRLPLTNETEFKNERAFKNENHFKNERENEPQILRGNEPTLHTKWGTAKLNSNGYFRITSGVEGNNMKFLHRLIYEEHYNCTLLPTAHIHHIDGDKTNNCILNLTLIPKKTHIHLHNLDRNTTGYYRVSCSKRTDSKTGVRYTYQYYEREENYRKKRGLSANSLKELERKVKEKGLPWRKLQ